MRILVTGAAGFIGSTLAERLLERGDEVVGLDSFDPYYSPELKRSNLAIASASPRFRLVEGDIRDRALVASLMEERFDALVHLAARAGVRPSIAEPATYADVNVTGTANLLEHAARAGLNRVVFASSSSVYGADSVPPFRTDARAVKPVSPYAATKRAGELLCESFCAVHPMTIASLRYFTVYGPRQRPDMAFHRFLRGARDGETLTVYGDGLQTRDFTYVGDIVAAVRAAALSGRPGAVYNVGGGERIALNDVLRLVETVTGRTLRVVRQEAQKGDMRDTFADTTAARTDLGFRSTVPLAEGLAREWEWLRGIA